MNLFKFAVCGFVCLALFAGCAKAPKSCCSQNAGNTASEIIVDFALLQGKNWQLSKVVLTDGTPVFDKSKLDAEKFPDVYTILFDGERASGKASPNRYAAPYSTDKNKISFKPAAGTKMMGLFSPEGLSENEFYKLLENAAIWSFANGELSIGSVNEKGEKTILIFTETK